MEPSTVIEKFKELVQAVDAGCPARCPELKTFLKNNAKRIVETPVSVHKHQAYAFAGGLILHTLNVVKIAEDIRSKYFSHISKESVFFCAFWHSMGLTGDETGALLLEQKDAYYNDKLGYRFKYADTAYHAAIQERSLYLINKNQIPITIDEWYAIKNCARNGSPSSGGYASFSTKDTSGASVNLPSELDTILQISVQLALRIESSNLTLTTSETTSATEEVLSETNEDR